MEKRYLIALAFLLFVLSMQEARAYVGVSPAAYSVDFQPNLKQVFSFNFYSDDPEIEFDIVATGDLSDYVTINKDELSGPGSVNVLLELPAKIEKPGKHRIYLAAAQRRKDTSSTLAIVANVRGVIDVVVPYPGKYAELEFHANNANAGEPVNFMLKIYSRGDESISTNSLIKTQDSENKTIGEFPLGTHEIPSAGTVEIAYQIDTTNYSPGIYNAKAIVNYHGEQATADSLFRLGELFVDVFDYTREFEREKINKFDIGVESFWNDPIENVYAEVSIIGYESLILPFSTPSVNLNGFERKNLSGHFDTSLIEEGKFNARIVVHYQGKTTEKITELRFKKEINYIVVGIVVGVVILVAVIILLIVWIRKLRKVAKKRR